VTRGRGLDTFSRSRQRRSWRRPEGRTSTIGTMSGEKDHETHLDEIRPGNAEVPERSTQRSKRLQAAFSDGSRQSIIAEAIRLRAMPGLLSRHAAGRITTMEAGATITTHDIDNLVAHVLSPDMQLAEAYLALIAARRISRAVVAETLFVQAARRLGACWETDECTSADVTLGVGHLMRLLHSSAMPQAPQAETPQPGRILIASYPGDQHLLGAAILEDCLRCAGWNTSLLLGPAHGQIEERLSSQLHDVLCLSLARGDLVEDAGALIRNARAQSANANLAVVIGGEAFRRPGADLVRLSADALALDFQSAVTAVKNLLRNRLNFG
jgi:MerR family transcriptional regulator, light-induced transcriptional regulator